MKKNIQYLIWLIFIFSHSAFGLISKLSSNDFSDNYNSTGVIIYRDYNSNLNVEPDIIKTYGYIESNQLTALIQEPQIKSPDDVSYESVNLLFALIPKKYGCTENTSEYASSNEISRMNTYLDNSYISPTIKEYGKIINDKNLINKEIATLSVAINHYLTEQNLNHAFRAEKKSQISKALVGSYGLFMPKNIEMLNKFNGIGRILTSAVSILDDLLLKATDFNTSGQNITKKQFAKLQFFIFKAMEQAKTVIFIPKCIAQKDTGGLRLPSALINKVFLNEDTGEITLNLMFCNNAINDFNGFYSFIDARNSLLGVNNLVTEWEFIDYTLELMGNNMTTESDSPYHSNSLLTLQYKFLSAQVEPNGCINHQANDQHEVADHYIPQPQQTYQLVDTTTTNIPTNIPTNTPPFINTDRSSFHNEEDLLSECRQPTQSEIARINNFRTNELTTHNNSITTSTSTSIPTFSDTQNPLFHNEENLLDQCRQPTQSEIKHINNLRTNDSIPRNNSITVATKKEKAIPNTLINNNTDFNENKCKHYQRNCLVKFDCDCDTYWCCHRSHNTTYAQQKVCKSTEIKSRNTQQLKCLKCDYEQDFNSETGNSCINCGIKFADYYCGKCKQFTGIRNDPFHCEKCGICRTNKNRAFHCDTCGICMDIKYKNNHKCLAESGHNQCGICLENVFSGCQTLSCGHKLHKACAEEMIKNRVNKCPMCREKFNFNLNKTSKRNSRRRR